MPNQTEHVDFLSQAKEGTNVYDSGGELIGTVSEVFFAASDEYDPNTVLVPVGGTQSQTAGGDIGTVGGTGGARDFENELSPEVRSSLLRQGYIKAKGGGVFGPVWYITPDQIASLDNDRITLNVAGSEVIRSR
jgi:hypothetical protein